MSATSSDRTPSHRSSSDHTAVISPAPVRRRPGRRSTRVIGVVTVMAGLTASAALVWQASYSAFSATTANPTNNWNAGTVTLNDDDAGSALFTVTTMKPGATGSKCIVVTSNGSLPSVVKLYTTTSSFAQTAALADNMTLTVTRGTNSTNPAAGSCANFSPDAGPITTTGTLTAFSTSYTSYANGFGNWTTTGNVSGESKVYKIDYTLNAGATNAQQGGTAAIGFTWEAQNS